MMGCLIGTFIGVVPGLGPMSAIALMMSIVGTPGPSTGLILMAALYCGAISGGSTSSILINAPGVASTIASSFDGDPMAQQGKALAITAVSSCSGGIVGAVFPSVAAPGLAPVPLSFQSSDYSALMFLGVVAVAAFAG